MAAKQGLTAHLSQAGEDAKRAVLSRTSYGTSTWFSNLNTVCTIKSAPPKTPAVLELLSTKSGWIFKRNEQHVWQARWCCIVPHMFLYYFDASSAANNAADGGNGGGAVDHSGGSGGGGSGSFAPGGPTSQQQDDWNNALQRSGFKAHEKRGFSLFNEANTTGATTAASASHPSHGHPSTNFSDGGDNHQPSSGTTPSSSGKFHLQHQQQPAGIIDLECYTCLHRSHIGNSTVLELAGDDTVNPDLRAFYFCVDSQASDEWADALLNGRHAALVDEVDAYKQVADGFASQLQSLHSECDDLKSANESLREELYRVRCAHEETRRKCCAAALEVLEHPLPPSPPTNEGSDVETEPSAATSTSTTDVEGYQEIQQWRALAKDALAVDATIPACLQALQAYVSSLEGSAVRLRHENSGLARRMAQTGESDQQRARELHRELDEARRTSRERESEYRASLDAAAAAQERTKKELLDTQKELSSTKLEFAMYSTQQKNKVQTLHAHKRVLKKEVVQLRQLVEDCRSDWQALQHSQESNQLAAAQHEQRAQLLERYVSQIETQLKCQQNLMEMMSVHTVSGSGGGGSVYGTVIGGGSVYGDYDSLPGPIAAPPLSPVGAGAAPRHRPTPNHPHRYSTTTSSLPPLRSRQSAMPPVSPRVVVVPNAAVVDRPDERPRQIAGQQGSGEGDDDDDLDDQDQYDLEARRHDHPRHTSTVDLLPPSFRRGSSFRDADADNKSHMSELTEDRTQRVLEGNWTASPRQYQHQQQHPQNHNHHNQVHPSSNHSPSAATPPPSYVEKQSHKLSVAHRSRIDADRQTTPVRVRLDGSLVTTPGKIPPQASPPPPPLSSSTSPSLPPTGSGVWKRMEAAVLGPSSDNRDRGTRRRHPKSSRGRQRAESHGSASTSDDSSSSSASGSESESGGEEKKRDAAAASTSSTPSAPSTSHLTLAQRSQLQRAMQLQFLKEQGLISGDKDVKGGAGGTPLVATPSPNRALAKLSIIASSGSSQCSGSATGNGGVGR